MTSIYYASFEAPLEPALFNKMLNLLPPTMHYSIRRFRKWEDAHAALFGKLLLQEGLSRFGIYNNLQAIKYTAFGRPYLEGAIDFNISHSGQKVVCALSEQGKIGIDIEQIKKISLDDFNGLFSTSEWEEIIHQKDNYARFYYYWTVKEAIIKAEGKGLNIPLTAIRINKDCAFCENARWYFQTINLFNGYAMHLASSTKTALDIVSAERVVFPEQLTRIN